MKISICAFWISFLMLTSLDFIFIQESDITIYPKEKVYIHTDRGEYGPGETIFFSAYLTEEGIDEYTSLSQVIYVELVNEDGSKVAFQQIKQVDGRASGSIEVPRWLNTQIITLRAYTSYMRNFDEQFFHRQPISIIGETKRSEQIAKKDIRLMAFPEGGELIDNQVSIVGVKLEQTGLGAQGEVEIVQDGEVINTVETNLYGFGQFVLKPEGGATYTIRYEGIEEQLPAAKSSGLSLRVRTSVDLFTVFINEQNIPDLAQHKLLVIADGQLLWNQAIETKIIKLDKKTIPTGLVTIAIVDASNKPVTERLVFNHYGIEEIFLDLPDLDQSFRSRSLVEVPIEVYDNNGAPIQAQLSASIVDNRYHYHRNDIVSTWLLESEIKGSIEKPHQYLLENSKEVIQKTDLLLLTQGWRSYNWTKTEGILFPKEKNLSISGRTVKPNKIDEGMKTYGSMSILSEGFQLVPFETDDDGYFFIDDVSLTDSVSLMFQAGTKKPKENEKIGGKARGNTKVDVILDKPLQHDVVNEDLGLDFDFGKQKKSIIPTYETVEAVAPEDDWYVDESLLLDEVTIREKKFDKWVDYYDDVTSYKEPDTRVFTDNGGAIEAYTDIYGVLRGRVTGIEITASLDGQSQRSVIIRGRSTGLDQSTRANNAAKWMVNGSFVSAATAEAIQPMDIAYVDVLKGLSQLAQYGELGAGGIIAIYLKPPGSRSRNRALSQENKGVYLDYQGYATAKEFFTPEYGSDSFYQKEKVRRTVHWEPLIKTDEEGRANISFYSSDYLGTYHIDVQGISDTGRPISGNNTVIVE